MAPTQHNHKGASKKAAGGLQPTPRPTQGARRPRGPRRCTRPHFSPGRLSWSEPTLSRFQNLSATPSSSVHWRGHAACVRTAPRPRQGAGSPPGRLAPRLLSWVSARYVLIGGGLHGRTSCTWAGPGSAVAILGRVTSWSLTSRSLTGEAAWDGRVRARRWRRANGGGNGCSQPQGAPSDSGQCPTHGQGSLPLTPAADGAAGGRRAGQGDPGAVRFESAGPGSHP